MLYFRNPHYYFQTLTQKCTLPFFGVSHRYYRNNIKVLVFVKNTYWWYIVKISVFSIIFVVVDNIEIIKSIIISLYKSTLAS